MSPRIAYIGKNFRPATLLVIEKANEILNEYAAQGYDLTLRQLYVQAFDELVEREERERETLTACSDRWPDVVKFLTEED